MLCVSDNNMAWRRRHGRCVTAKECVIEATVPTGFEAIAAEEVDSIFRTQCATVRGKITFQTPTERVKDILKLGGVDHCRVQILHVPSFGFTMDPEDCLSRLQLLVKRSQWREGLGVWSEFQSFSHTDAADFSLPDSMPDDRDLTCVCFSPHFPAPHGCGHVGEGGMEPNLEHSAMDGAKTDLDFQSDPARAKLTEGGGRDKQDIRKNSLDERTGVDGVENVQCENGSRPNMVSDSDTLSAERRNIPAVRTGNSLTTSNSHNRETSRKIQKSSSDHESAMIKSPNQVTGGKLPKSQQDSGDSVKETRTSPRRPRFRVTCQRAGQGHCFDSMSVAASFGHSVKMAFGWEVNLTDFDVEVVVHISDDDVSVSLALTPDSLHRRDMVAFGVATLRSTIACNMLRMVDIQPGHLVCDPLCGTSAIPIQGALRFPGFQLSGDNSRAALQKTLHNTAHLSRRQAAQGRGGLKLDSLRWNACSLPLRDGVVDAFVSDLPFGKRVGRRSTNVKLYSAVLQEMSRCSKPSARAALLTADVNNMTKALKSQRHWSLLRRSGCNIGGLSAAVFLLHHTYVTCRSYSQHAESYPKPRRMR